MRDAAHITVVHEGETIRSLAFRFSGAQRWIAEAQHDDRGGDFHMSDEGVQWVRGWLYPWWPPHKKRIDALRVASALAGPRPAPLPHHIPAQAQKTYDAVVAAFNGDWSKIMGDAARVGINVGATTVYVRRRVR